MYQHLLNSIFFMQVIYNKTQQFETLTQNETAQGKCRTVFFIDNIKHNKIIQRPPYI